MSTLPMWQLFYSEASSQKSRPLSEDSDRAVAETLAAGTAKFSTQTQDAPHPRWNTLLPPDVLVGRTIVWRVEPVIPDDDPILLLGTDPIILGVHDASTRHDEYLY
jgi:hypothetical protein